jgi:radical SAM protein with 4Fe4S-binding SPASM domain
LIHGTKEINLKRTLKNIEYAANLKKKKGYNVTIGIQQVLLPENAEDVLTLAQISKDIGVDYFVLKPFSLHELNDHYPEAVSAIQLRDRYLDKLEKAEALSDRNFSSIIRWNTFLDDGIRTYDRCLGLPFISQIAANGKVYTCCPFFYNDEFMYGDLEHQSFSEIWYGDRAKTIREGIEQNLDVHQHCMSYCRHHQINMLLWKLANPPAHINFI